jgi:uncharacterized protein YjiS (DUF1127 family)
MLLRLLLRDFRFVFRLWREVRRQRRELLDLDEHLLKDIGISRTEALQESRRPVWEICAHSSGTEPRRRDSSAIAASSPRPC